MATGSFGDIKITVNNVTAPGNRKTSFLAILSLSYQLVSWKLFSILFNRSSMNLTARMLGPSFSKRNFAYSAWVATLLSTSCCCLCVAAVDTVLGNHGLVKWLSMKSRPLCIFFSTLEDEPDGNNDDVCDDTVG
jgi:hypothetical protein